MTYLICRTYTMKLLLSLLLIEVSIAIPQSHIFSRSGTCVHPLFSVFMLLTGTAQLGGISGTQALSKPSAAAPTTTVISPPFSISSSRTWYQSSKTPNTARQAPVQPTSSFLKIQRTLPSLPKFLLMFPPALSCAGQSRTHRLVDRHSCARNRGNPST